MIVAGIDPGAKGGVALLSSNGVLIAARKMPLLKRRKNMVDCMKLSEFLDRAAVVIIEDVHSMPRQGVASSHQFGRIVGQAEGVVMTMGIPLEHVTPAVWKKHFGLSSDKRASLDRMKLLYPNANKLDWNVLANEGIAEAIMLARWLLEKRNLHAEKA